jgi:hypothetical protein
MVGYQPAVFVPVFARRLSPVRLAQAAPAPASRLSPGMVRAALTGGLLLETALAGATTWVGLWTGMNASGLLKILGYGVGGLAAVSGVISLAELAIYVGKGMPVPADVAPAPAPAPSTREFTAQ